MKRLVKLIGAITRMDAGRADLVGWATSPHGLNFPLYPRQRLALKLIAGQADFARQVLWSGDHPPYDEASDLARLIDSDDTHASVWLPANWKFNRKKGRLYIPNRPLIVLAIAGRRSGKTTIASIAITHALIELNGKRRFHGIRLLPGQTVGAINVAADEQQARVLFERAVANLHIAGITDGKIPASGRVRIGRWVLYECLPTSAGAVRGRTVIVCALDELAHFPGTTGPASAGMIFDALLPSVRTFGPHGQVIITTSPAGRQGKVWELYQQRGQRDDLLVMQFATWEMNPFITREMLETDFAIDPVMASCEYGAQFVAVDSAFLEFESVAACVRRISRGNRVANLHAPRRLHIDLAFTSDRLAIAVGHREQGGPDSRGKNRVYIDEVRVLQPAPGAPLVPSDVEEAVADIAGRYRIHEVSFDQFCAPYLQRQLRAMGLRTRRIDFTSSSKPAIYTNLRALIAGRMISLPDDADLVAELTHLRRTVRPGGFSVAAPSSGGVTTDDMADAVAALAYLLTRDDDYDGRMVYQPGVFA